MDLNDVDIIEEMNVVNYWCIKWISLMVLMMHFFSTHICWLTLTSSTIFFSFATVSHQLFIFFYQIEDHIKVYPLLYTRCVARIKEILWRRAKFIRLRKKDQLNRNDRFYHYIFQIVKQEYMQKNFIYLCLDCFFFSLLYNRNRDQMLHVPQIK